MEWLFSLEVTSVVLTLAISIALGVLSLNDFGLAKFFFYIAASDAIGGIIMDINRSGLSVWWQGVLAFAFAGCIGLLLFFALRYVDSKKEKATTNSPLQEQTVHKDAVIPETKKSFPHSMPTAQSKPQHHPSPYEDLLQTGHSNAQNAQAGNSNQQSITVHNAPVQTMIDSPGGIQAGGEVKITGKVIPPPRFIPQSKFAAAVSILKTAPAGSKVSFIVVGGSEEITAITQQMKDLFAAAKDKWEILPGSFVGSLTNTVLTDSGIKTHHGEGINCTFGSSETLAYRIGVKAMKAAGIPCGNQDITADNPNVDISIMIGTRIVPED